MYRYHWIINRAKNYISPTITNSTTEMFRNVFQNTVRLRSIPVTNWIQLTWTNVQVKCFGTSSIFTHTNMITTPSQINIHFGLWNKSTESEKSSLFKSSILKQISFLFRSTIDINIHIYKYIYIYTTYITR